MCRKTCIFIMVTAISIFAVMIYNSFMHPINRISAATNIPSFHKNITSTGLPRILSDFKKNDIILRKNSSHMPFISNRGQTNKDVKFYANTFGGTVFVTHDGEIVYSLPVSAMSGHQNNEKMVEKNMQSSNIVLKEKLIDCNIDKIQGESAAVTKVSYLKGTDSSKWINNITTYDVVSLGEVYDDIRLKLKAYGNNVEKLFYVGPNAKPETINIHLEGAGNLRINDSGELEVGTERGLVKFTAPVAYQEIDGQRLRVEVAYNISSDSEYSFLVGDYDRSRELVIDPMLASTFLGGTEYDDAGSIAIDSRGNVYIVGVTTSSDFPSTVDGNNSPQTGDVFISKLTSDLTTLISATYFGGNNYDFALSIAIDKDDNVFIAGESSSPDFPATNGAYKKTCGTDEECNPYAESGGIYRHGDIFISKLSNDLSMLLASTFIGGSNGEHCESIAIDATGNIYITGMTFSADYPVTENAYDLTCGTDGNCNPGDEIGHIYYVPSIFISKLDSDLTTLIASTFFAGSKTDIVYSLALDSGGNVYISGETNSIDFPTTPRAYSETYNGGIRDAFISVFSSDLTTLLFSTYIGGSDPMGSEEAMSIALDSNGAIYVTGVTSSYDFPTTTDAFNTSYDGTFTSAFISKLSGDLTTMHASTFLNWNNNDAAYLIGLDSNGSVYVAGRTHSTDFPGRITPVQKKSWDSPRPNIFISKLDNNLNNLVSSTCFGGFSGPNKYTSAAERVAALAIDSKGDLYVTGSTNSPKFPVTKNSYDMSHNGNIDLFVTKFDSNLSTYKIITAQVGTGSGTITSDPSGIICGSKCLDVFVNNSGVKLIAKPDIGSGFQGWDGACSGKGKCIVKMDADKDVSASFIKLSPQISVSPATMSFREMTVGAYKGTSKTLRIINKGKGILTASVSVDSDDFSSSWEGKTITIMPKSSQGIGIIFAPASLGPRTATLTVTSDDPKSPTKTVTLKGTGK